MFRFALIVAVSTGCAVGQESASNCSERYSTELKTNPQSSLVHFRIGECFARFKYRVDAVNEFRRALNGDKNPSWVMISSHIEMSKIFDDTRQHERALNEYRIAEENRKFPPGH